MSHPRRLVGSKGHKFQIPSGTEVGYGLSKVRMYGCNLILGCLAALSDGLPCKTGATMYVTDVLGKDRLLGKMRPERLHDCAHNFTRFRVA